MKMYCGTNGGANSAHGKHSIESKSERSGTSLSRVGVTEMEQAFVTGRLCVHIGREGKQLGK